MTNERLSPPTYILGRITTLSDGTQAIQPVHRETVLLYQQKVRALISVATEYANDPSDDKRRALLQIAKSFAENA